MARILWACCTQPGSLFPAVPIVQELVARGHRVTATAGSASPADFAPLGCDFVPVRHIDALLAEPAPPAADRGLRRERHRRYAQAMFADVCDALRAQPYDVMLADALETGTAFAAEAMGVPCVSYVHHGMDEVGPDVPFCFHFWDRTEPAEVAFPAFWNDVRDAVGLGPDPRPQELQRWYRTSPLLALVLGLPDLVHPRGELPAFARRVGPLVWDPPQAEPLPDWVGAVGRERPAILASVSTVRQADADPVVTVAQAAADLGVEVVATVAREHDLPPLPGHAVVAPFVPHSALMHRVSAVACHAGYGTVTRAACAGVPLLLYPAGRDQFQVARGAEHAGIAVVLGVEDRGIEATRAALQALLYDGGYTERARELARVAAGYDAARTAADLVESVLAGAAV